eukprot:CAMPEP_0205822108 /NCGR_PEP_ID=MMETSP0206-20130828/10882_1 /ASSEMBLY_ACC=CAM_ASM_000279 /TAXON_ID=36767 /ORGANISM="Euplotes focardii, Strain TN1" /LENGTH=310 /DNA_ID=CAMNT_0053118099 /DNA_START=212 /DNA_END=1144 /DNA_ORIENTATION=+
MNTSTMLARRTRKLIREIQPDSVMVMTSPKWWDSSRLIEGVHSQEDFKNYSNLNIDKFEVDTSLYRGVVFNARMKILQTALTLSYRTGNHFKFWIPGLEMKYACEEAEKLGAELHFLGPELNNITWHRLYHEHRINIPHVLFKLWEFSGTRWASETQQQIQKLQLTTPSSYVETCNDSYNMNWYIQSLDILFPALKRILIDKRDMALYKYITRNSQEGQKIVAVVNQWHMEGIEHLWAHEYGLLPRSQSISEEIDPIGDMPLKEGLFDMLYNAFQRELKNAHSKTTPASYSNMMNTYHREQNWQYEHRNM